MKLMTLTNSISNIMMKLSSSIFQSGLDANSLISAVTVVGDAEASSGLVQSFSKLIYFIAKWMMYFLDILFIYIQELAGFNMNTSSLDAAITADSDIVFRLLLTNRRQSSQIIRNLSGLALACIIIFSVAAIVIQEYRSFKDNKPADVMGVLRTAGKSIALMIITPFIALLGIVASNLILKSLYNATNASGSCTLSTQIFSASSTAANSYRTYAANGQRIPIKYDFSEAEEYMEYFEDATVTSQFKEYLSDAENNPLYATYLMFSGGNHYKFGQLYNTNTLKAYHTFYDDKDNGTDSEGKNRIVAHQAEYYVMADVVDYCIRTSIPVYFKTIEEVLETATAVDAAILTNLSGQIIDTFDIGQSVSGYYDYLIDYFKPTEEGTASGKDQIKYYHKKGEVDEYEGAKYIIAIEKEIVSDGTTYKYFYPLTVGYSINGSDPFISEFIYSGQMIAAKGLFDECKYPTAITQNADRSEIVFYREDLTDNIMGMPNDVVKVDLVTDEGGFFAKVGYFFKALFDPASLLPKLTFDPDKLLNSYESSTTTINTIKSGKLHIGYMFTDTSIFSKWTDSTFGLKLDSLFNPGKLNLLILIAGTLILIKVSFAAIFGLIARAYDLFMIILMYPTVCATMPIDENGYKQWMQQYIGKLLATYGYLLGINFVMMLFPIVQQLELFTTAEVGSSKIIKRIGNMLSGLPLIELTVNSMTAVINNVFVILCQLVLFTTIQTASETISKFANTIPNENNPFEVMKNVTKIMGHALSAVVTGIKGVVGIGKVIFSAKARKDALHKAMPGSAIIDDAKGKINLMKLNHEKNKAIRDMKKHTRKGQADDGKTMERFDKVLKAQSKYEKALKNPVAAAKAESDRKWQEKRTGMHSRDKDDPNEDGIDVSDKSDRDLKQDKKRYKKYIRRLKWKGGIGKRKLSDEELKTLNTYTALLDKTKEERKNRKTSKSEYKDSKKTAKKLSKKSKKENGLLLEDNLKLEEARQKVSEYEKQQEELKKRSKEVKSNKKADQKAKKKKAKQAEKQRKKKENEELLFQNVSWIRKGQQKRVIKNLEKEADNIDDEFIKKGMPSLKAKSNEEIQEMLADPEKNNLSPEDIQKMQEYLAIRKKQEGLINLNDQAHETVRETKLNYNKRRNIEAVGAKGGLHLINRTRLAFLSRSDTDAKKGRIVEINSQLENMQKSGAVDFDKRRKLLAEKARLERQVAETDSWSSMNSKQNRKQVVAERRQAHKMERRVRNSWNYLEERGKDVNYDSVMRSVQRTEQLREERAREKAKKKKKK